MRSKPTNPLVNALLTDKYQLTTVYAMWLNGIHEEEAVFNLFFRKCPLKVEFAIFVGLDEALRFIENFSFTESDIKYLKEELPYCKSEFFDWLAGLDSKGIRVKAIPEGNLVFPREPLMVIEGPLGKSQLLETALLNQVGFASLDATNAAKYRLFVGQDKKLVEFSLRRCQGADGAMTVARSSYIGGFNGTSNVQAGKVYGIPIFGTHPHSYITAFSGVKVDKTKWRLLDKKQRKERNLWVAVSNFRKILATRAGTSELGFWDTNISELEAFTAYAFASPDNFLALVDTYNSLKSGVPNYICVALALLEFGYQPLGIRLDSGDLALLSKKARAQFEVVAMAYPQFADGLLKSQIFASDSINHEKLRKIYGAGHAIDAFGIGTSQGTCEEQPAIGVVFKLVQIAGKPCIKESDDSAKTILPGAQKVYRLWQAGPVADIITLADEAPPVPDKKITLYLPDGKTITIRPMMIQWMHNQVIPDQKLSPGIPEDTVHTIRDRVAEGMRVFPKKHLNFEAPVKYPVGVSYKLQSLQHKLLTENKR